jgi:hypothetical protein
MIPTQKTPKANLVGLHDAVVGTIAKRVRAMKLKLDRQMRAALMGVATQISIGLVSGTFPDSFSATLRLLADEIDRQNQ